MEKRKVKLVDKHVYQDDRVILTVNTFEQNMVMAEFIRKRELKEEPEKDYWPTIYFNPTIAHRMGEYDDFIYEMKRYKDAKVWFFQLLASLYPDCNYYRLRPEEYKSPKGDKIIYQEWAWVFSPDCVTNLWSEVAYDKHPFSSLDKCPTFLLLPDEQESIYDLPLPEEDKYITWPIALKSYLVYDKDISKVFDFAEILEDLVATKRAEIGGEGSVRERFAPYKNRDDISYWIEVRWVSRERIRLCITFTTHSHE